MCLHDESINNVLHLGLNVSVNQNVTLWQCTTDYVVSCAAMTTVSTPIGLLQYFHRAAPKQIDVFMQVLLKYNSHRPVFVWTCTVSLIWLQATSSINVCVVLPLSEWQGEDLGPNKLNERSQLRAKHIDSVFHQFTSFRGMNICLSIKCTIDTSFLTLSIFSPSLSRSPPRQFIW